MTPVDASVIRRKLAGIAEGLERLGPLGTLTVSQYRERFYERQAAERILQRVIEAAIDVNTHLIVEAGQGVPDDYHESFVKLGGLGVLSPDFAARLAPAAGLRNRLVHEYDTLDDAKVHAAIATTLELFPRYVQAVEAWLTKAGL